MVDIVLAKSFNQFFTFFVKDNVGSFKIWDCLHHMLKNCGLHHFYEALSNQSIYLHTKKQQHIIIAMVPVARAKLLDCLCMQVLG